MGDKDIDLEYETDPSDFHCYRCGKECTEAEPEEEGELIEYHLMCPDCGWFTIASENYVKWWVKDEGIPYILGSMSTNATLYHEFDPKAYPNEREAILAEMELLNKLSDEYVQAGDHDSFVKLDKRKIELYERSFSIGMDELSGQYAAFSYNLMTDEKVGSEKYEKYLRIFNDRLHDMDVDDLSKVIIGLSMDRMLGRPTASRFEEVAGILYEKADDWDGTYSYEKFQRAFMAANVLGLVGEYERPRALLRKCLESVRGKDVEQSEEFTALVWAELRKRTFDDDELIEMMNDMRPLRDKNPLEYSECAIHFGKELCNVPSLRPVIKEDMDWTFDNTIPFVRTFDDATDLEMNAGYVRSIVSGNRTEMRKAVDLALSVLRDDGDNIDEDTAWILVDYLENRGRRDRLADRIRQRVRAAGMEMEDLYRYAGF